MTSEFPTQTKQHPPQDQRELAAAYCRLFSGEDGRRVLADLTMKFDPLRPRFFGHSDTHQAAKIDGQCDVLREIQRAIKAGSPLTGIPIPN
jgi:hypothetical protein